MKLAKVFYVLGLTCVVSGLGISEGLPVALGVGGLFLMITGLYVAIYECTR